MALGAAGIFLFASGLILGTRTTDQATPESLSTVTVTVASPETEGRLPPGTASTEARRAGHPRTTEGAVTAATAYASALGGPAILDPGAVRTVLAEIASSKSRAELIRAYESAASQARERLGVETPSDGFILRTTPAGYRVDGFQPDAATISIWRVGVIASSGALEPQHSWRTETFSLVWENGAWKIDAVRSTPGPTPPLATPATPPAELVSAISSFDEFTRGLP